MPTYYLGKSGPISLLVSSVGIIVVVSSTWFQTGWLYIHVHLPGQSAKNGLDPEFSLVAASAIFTLSCFMKMSLTQKW